MPSPDSITDCYLDPFEIGQIREWLWHLRERFGHSSLELVLVFVSPRFAEHSGLLLSLIKDELNPNLIAGCTSTSLISNALEHESVNGFSIGLFHLPGSQLQTTCFSQREVDGDGSPSSWHQHNEIENTNGWIVFADPFHLDLENWLAQWNQAYPNTPILGGLATGPPGENRTEIYLNDQVFSQGGIAISISGQTQIRNVISQGCTPIGDPWIVTKASKNVLYELGNQKAYDALLKTVNEVPKNLAHKIQGNLFIGLVIDEYHEDFQRGDFLVRNLLGADQEQGAIAIGALPRMGQTVQFQLRSPDAARQDLQRRLQETQETLHDEVIHGGLLCTCNGRGQRLFGRPNTDAGCVVETLGNIGLVGFFCNGELGPVGDQNFLHGYTASLALFTSKKPTAN